MSSQNQSPNKCLHRLDLLGHFQYEIPSQVHLRLIKQLVVFAIRYKSIFIMTIPFGSFFLTVSYNGTPWTFSGDKATTMTNRTSFLLSTRGHSILPFPFADSKIDFTCFSLNLNSFEALFWQDPKILWCLTMSTIDRERIQSPWTFLRARK